MQDKPLTERLARARQLLAEIHHVPIATVNEDGSPHNSPVFMAFDDDLNAFWASNIDSQHSQNIARTGRVFLVIFDSREGRGGLYIEAHAEALQTPGDIADGHKQLKDVKQQLYGGTAGLGDPDFFNGSTPQRIYRATPQRLWVNASERNADGIYLRDKRLEISLKQLRG
ncbi:MAG TPA: pyridoxamine 5'-phosphate oxidase family protein [Candidatus Saccharimonadales bacterium]|nr:pyridoxamine 5'-phosphate oxidase family protein [Candidatus Saccharimonadales bacterium]